MQVSQEPASSRRACGGDCPFIGLEMEPVGSQSRPASSSHEVGVILHLHSGDSFCVRIIAHVAEDDNSC